MTTMQLNHAVANIERGIPDLPHRRLRTLAWQIALCIPVLVAVALFSLPPLPYPLVTVTGVLLLILVSTASVTDLLWNKIPNWATYSAFLWALVINAYVAISGAQSTTSVLGAIGIAECLLGAIVPFLFMLVVFSITGGGAGDVKLVAAIGAFLGPSQTVDAVLISFIFAGGFALMRAVMLKGPREVLELVWRTVGSWFIPLWIRPPTPEQQAFLNRPMPLAPSFALGTLVVLFELDVPRLASEVLG